MERMKQVLASVVLVVAALFGIDYAVSPAPAPVISVLEDDKPLNVKIEGETEQLPGYMVCLKAIGEAEKYSWRGDLPFRNYGTEIVFSTPIEGKYNFTLAAAKRVKGDIELQQYDHVVVIQAIKPPTPVPPQPTPVPPEPTPVPPTPTPVPPQPTPQPGGINVLIIEESDERTPELTMLLSNWTLLDWLNKHCEPAQKQKAMWLITDDDVEYKLEPWKALSQQHVAKMPWIVITGKGGKPVLYGGPLPSKEVTKGGKTVTDYPLEDTLNLLKQYGGS
jgi:hypothetical protein